MICFTYDLIYALAQLCFSLGCSAFLSFISPHFFLAECLSRVLGVVFGDEYYDRGRLLGGCVAPPLLLPIVSNAHIMIGLRPPPLCGALAQAYEQLELLAQY